MKKRKVRKTIIVSIAVLGVLVFLRYVPTYLINVATNHRLHYAWIEFGGIFAFGTGNYTSLGYTPDKSFSLHLVDYSWQGTCICIETTQKFSYKPKTILELNEEGLKAPIGPLGDIDDIVCSADSRYIAFVINGWYSDFYDFKTGRRDSLDLTLVGQLDQENINSWEIYHKKIANLMGQNTISITKKLPEFEENKQR